MVGRFSLRGPGREIPGYVVLNLLSLLVYKDIDLPICLFLVYALSIISFP